MKHRHLSTQTWNLAAIDSVLEYGNLQDWKELFIAVKKDLHIANKLNKLILKKRSNKSSALAKILLDSV